MTLKDIVLEALNRVSEEELNDIIKTLSSAVAKAPEEGDAAQKLEQRRKSDRERQARHRASKTTKEAPAKEEPVVEEEEDFAAKYEDKTAPELFKLCKARKMTTVEPRKNQRYYIDMLVELDKKEAAAKAKEEEEAAETDGLDWGDEEEEEKLAKKATGRKGAAKGKKADPEPEAEEEEEEWDI